MAKGQDKWRCTNCHSKQASLRRAFGRWPTAAFTSLGKEDRAKFWAGIENLPGKLMIAKAEELLETYEKHSERYYDRLEIWTLTRSQRASYAAAASWRQVSLFVLRHAVVSLSI